MTNKEDKKNNGNVFSSALGALRVKFNVIKNQGNKKEEKKNISVTKTQKEKRKLNEPILFRSYSTKERVHFAKRLAFLTRSGVPILESLYILRKQTKSRSKGKIIEIIIEDVRQGKYLSDGLGRFHSSFGDFAISVVRIGEMSGSLSNNLTYLAEELQKKQALKRKVISALVYPAFITVATIAVSVLLTVYIFPKVMPIFTSLNVALPLTTRILLFISNFLQNWGFHLLGAIAVAIVALIFFIKTSKPFHYFVSRNILRIPLVGRLVLEYNIVNFCRTFSLLLKSGFGVVDAAAVTAESTANPVYKKEMQELRNKVVQGERVSKHFEENPAFFPDIMSHMVMIGETSGTLSDTLMYLADHYEEEVEDLIKNLSSAIEPILMVFMGLIVGFVAVSVITPIYAITQSLQR